MGDLRGVEATSDTYTEGGFFEQDAIPWARVGGVFAGIGDCTVETDYDLPTVDLYNCTEEKAVVVTERAVDEFLVVVSFQKSGGQPAAEKHFEWFHVLCIEACSVQCLAVGS